MPSTTANGLPYPLPSEPVRDGATAIKNLADALQYRGGGYLVQAGSAVVTLNAQGDGQIPIPVAYRAGTKPVYLLQISDPLGSFWIAPNYNSSNNTAMPFRVTTQGASGPMVPGTGPYRVNWYVIGTAV